MGWVTLTLRKMELRHAHAEYQLRDLEISRERRKMARQYSFQQSVLNHQMQEEIAAAKNDSNYQNAREAYRNGIGSADSANLQAAYMMAKEDYEANVNNIKDFYDEEIADIEEEAQEAETRLDEEQTQVEAQMEAISQEIQAVSDAISNEIQSTTIKLN